MINFKYNNPAKVIFGDGAENEIENLLKEYNVSSLLLVYSGNFIKKLGIWDTVHSACQKLNSAFYEEGNVVPNPKIELVRDLVSFQTSCGIAEIFSHLLERYFTEVENVDITDFLLEGAMKALILNAHRLMKNPNNYNARAEVQWLASIAHNNLLDTGRISDWGSHRIEHEVSAQYGITHGEGMAIVMTAWTPYMSSTAHKLKKLAQLANRVFNIDYHDYSEEEIGLILSEKLKKFLSLLI